MIIVSITGPTMKEALDQVKRSSRHADMFEFRLDLIKEPPLSFLLSSTSKPIVATCRSAQEGGSFDGSEPERIEILRAAAELGADFIDIEMSCGKKVIDGIIHGTRTKVIVSYHQFENKGINAGKAYARLRRSGGDVLKFAYMASDAADIRHAFEFLALARRDRQRAIAIAMGECGEPSRILYRKFGGWATYASAENGQSAAPGQISGSMMKTVYRADRLTRGTKVFGVVGNPVRQSKGIYVHNPLFQKAGKNSVYCRFEVHNIAAFAKHLFPKLGGFSVTLPYKQSVMKYIDHCDATATGIGAANTVVFRNGKSFATNTDAAGALDAIEKASKVAGKRLLILGAGGAARSIAYEAKRRGARVLITNRTESAAKELAKEFGIEYISRANLVNNDFDILVNATPVGMTPNVNESPIAKSLLRTKVVFDAIYSPPVTRLLRDARSVGAKIIQGTEMYLNQAVLQSKLYTGKKPSLALMRRLLG